MWGRINTIEVAYLSSVIDYLVNEKSFTDDKYATTAVISLFHIFLLVVFLLYFVVFCDVLFRIFYGHLHTAGQGVPPHDMDRLRWSYLGARMTY